MAYYYPCDVFFLYLQLKGILNVTELLKTTLKLQVKNFKAVLQSRGSSYNIVAIYDTYLKHPCGHMLQRREQHRDGWS